jgi:uncharacterized damage-inducible protein DinB
LANKVFAGSITSSTFYLTNFEKHANYMKLSFKSAIPLIIISFPLRAQNIDSLFLKASIIKLEHAKKYTSKVAELMPGEKYNFKPTPDEMTFGEQLLHLSANMKWLCTSYLSSSEIPILKTSKQCQNKECIITELNETYDYAIYVLRHFNPLQLSDTVTFFAGPMNKIQIINLLNDHQTHHRAQLLVYLRLNGIKPPEYVGW